MGMKIISIMWTLLKGWKTLEEKENIDRKIGMIWILLTGWRALEEGQKYGLEDSLACCHTGTWKTCCHTGT